MMPRGIGSVLPVPQPVGTGIWTEWTEGWNWRGFRTARAALAAFLRHRNIRRIWLPAYVCRVITETVNASGIGIGWYAVDDQLNARLSDLDSAESGEAVLTISYFGRDVDASLRKMATDRPDLLWIDDRAQALRPQHLSFADALLYSPRKLFGVGDGGLILTNESGLPGPSLPPVDDDLRPHLARADDPDGLSPEDWFPPFQAREAEMDDALRSISATTLDALRTLDAEAEIHARRCNWTRLSARLSSVALWQNIEVDFSPLAYPVVVGDAASLSAHLAASRIWCARHWSDLPSPASFTAAHDLSRRCLSLPLDGRYDEVDMARMADAVQAWSGYPR